MVRFPERQAFVHPANRRPHERIVHERVEAGAYGNGGNRGVVGTGAHAHAAFKKKKVTRADKDVRTMHRVTQNEELNKGGKR